LVDALKQAYTLRELLKEVGPPRSSYFYHRARLDVSDRYIDLRRTMWELKPKAFWDLPQQHITHRIDAVVMTIVTFSRALRLDRAEGLQSQLRCAVEITCEHDHPVAGPLRIRTWGHKSDAAWTVSLEDRTRTASESYRVYSGEAALGLTELAALTGAHPKPADVPAEGAAEQAAFEAAVAVWSDRSRDLRFVALALGIEPRASDDSDGDPPSHG